MQHFDNHTDVWSNAGIVVTGVTKVRSVVDNINAAALKQNENNPTGYTASKEQTRDLLETTVYLTALRVRSYAGATGNETLAQKTQFSRSSLDILGTNDLCIVADTLANACEEYSGNLAEYQVDQSTANSLRELAAKTKTLYAQRDTVVDERMEATARLKQLFAELRRLLKTLDDLVEAFIDDDVFVATYFNARRIHDLKGRHAAQTKEEE
jgi:enamine deaminase RidA (YjgF/YER057c/UK114 family)